MPSRLVETNRPRAGFGFHRLQNSVVAGRLFVQHGQRAIAVRREYMPRRRIEDQAVGIGTEGRAVQYVPISRIDYNHEIVATSGEQSVMDSVDSEGCRSFAGAQRPFADDGKRARVEY